MTAGIGMTPEPLELPAAGVFLQHGVRATWIAQDPVMAPMAKTAQPASGFVLLYKAPDGWRSYRLAENTLRGARTAALSAVHKSMEPMVLGKIYCAQRPGQAFLVEAVARYEPVTTDQLLRMALDAADEVLEHLQKAEPDPFKAATFDRMVERLGSVMASKSDQEVRSTVDRVVKESRIDWAKATEADHKAFSKALAAALGVTAVSVWGAMKASVLSAAQRMATASAKAFVKTHKIGVGYNLAQQDKTAVLRAASANHIYIRDFYTGKIAPTASRMARGIVSEGVAQGQGSEVIAERLYRVLGSNAMGLNRGYMNVVASAANARARMFSSLLMMDRSGIMVYRVAAVQDDHTTDTCRWLNGKTFAVGSAIAHHRHISDLDDPMDIRHEAPWSRERVITSGVHKGKKGIFIPRAGGALERIAVIERSAFGLEDAVGQYSGLNTQELASRGFAFPPYHAYCRSTVVPAAFS